MSVVLDVIVHITNGSKRNSDPRLRIVFFHRWNTNFDTKLEVLKGRRDFQNRSNSRVSLNPSFRFRSWIISRYVYSRQATDFRRNSLAFLVTKYCPTSTTLINPASLQNLLNLSSSESRRTC